MCCRAGLRRSYKDHKKTGARYSEWEANIALAELAVHTHKSEEGQMFFERAMEIEGMDAYKHNTAQLDSLKAQLYSFQDDELPSRA